MKAQFPLDTVPDCPVERSSLECGGLVRLNILKAGCHSLTHYLFNAFCCPKLIFTGVLAQFLVAAAPAVSFETTDFPAGEPPKNLRDITALPFTGPPSSLALDEEFDALSRAEGLDPDSADAMRSIAGKQALWRAIASYLRDHRSTIITQVLKQYECDVISGTCADQGKLGQNSVFQPLIRYADRLQSDLDALDVELRAITRSLTLDSELASRFRKVLEHPEAVEAVYVAFIYPVYLATGGVPDIEDLLGVSGQGAVFLKPQSAAKARSIVERLNPMLPTVRQLSDNSGREAARIVESDEWTRALKKVLGDPLTTAIKVDLGMRSRPGISAGQLHDLIDAQWNDQFSPAGSGLVPSRDLTRDKIEKSLNILYRLCALTQSNASRLRMLLKDDDVGDDLSRELASVMLTDLGAASLVSEEALKPLTTVFYDSSMLGSSLVKEAGGSWSINPHREREMALAVSYLELRLRDYDANRELLDGITSNMQSSAEGNRLAEFALLSLAEIGNLRDIGEMAKRWVAENFEGDRAGLRLRQGAAPRIREILHTVDDSVPPLEIDLAPGKFDSKRTQLLRSSTYLFLRSGYARDVYFNEFEDHYAARIWGIFDWNSQEAGNEGQFRDALSKQAPLLRQIAATHEKVIVYVFHTPRWLTGSNEDYDVDGRPAYLLHSPRDYDGWRKYVGETVRFLKEQLKGVDVYYEIWNEPEFYWLEGHREYLRLYAETASAIRQEHPEAKIGGAAMNGWDGRAKGERGGDPLNLELIRYATREALPLDFIAWHYFERPVSDLEAAKSAYLAELENLGVGSLPELVISEWSIPGRGTRNEPSAFAEYMLSLYRADVAIQTVAAWEEFSVHPRPQDLPPWGMLTNQGFKKPMFHVHTFFDRLSRDSTGIAEFESQDKRTKIVASRKRDGSYELVMWEARNSRPLEAALQELRNKGLSASDLRPYGTMDQLEHYIQAGSAISGQHASAFRSAQEIYRNTPVQENSLVLQLAGVRQIKVTATDAVGVRSAGRQVFTSGNKLVAILPRGEVMWLRLEVD